MRERRYIRHTSDTRGLMTKGTLLDFSLPTFPTIWSLLPRSNFPNLRHFQREETAIKITKNLWGVFFFFFSFLKAQDLCLQPVTLRPFPHNNTLKQGVSDRLKKNFTTFWSTWLVLCHRGAFLMNALSAHEVDPKRVQMFASFADLGNFCLVV